MSGRGDNAAHSGQTGPVVISIARSAIASRLGVDAAADESAQWLRERAATFVTLRRQGDLRGCIGTVEAHRQLVDDVKANAIGAAFADPRFAPLARDELDDTRIEVSILSPVEPLDNDGEHEVRRLLRPFVDGVVLRFRGRRATFLPQVWQQLPEPADFLAALKRKAGLTEDFWAADLDVWRYTVTKYSEWTDRNEA